MAALGAQATGNGSVSAPTLAVGPLTCSSGDLLVLCFAGRDATNTVDSVVGSLNGAFTRCRADQISGNNVSSMWYFQNSGAGDETVTITYSANSRGEANLSRWTGIATTNALDDSNGATNASGTAHNAGSIDATGAGVIVTSFEFGADEGSVTQTGFTELSETAFARGYFSYQIITGATTTDGALTSGSTTVSVGVITNFLDSGGAATYKRRRATLLGI